VTRPPSVSGREDILYRLAAYGAGSDRLRLDSSRRLPS